LSVKKEITDKCTEFVCTDIRPFETIAGEGFAALAQSFIALGVKYGQVSAKDVLPHPTTVARNISQVANTLRDNVVKPDLCNCLNKWGGGVTTDMWTETHTQTSYIMVTVHYTADD